MSETGFVTSGINYVMEACGTKGSVMIHNDMVEYCCEETGNKVVAAHRPAREEHHAHRRLDRRPAAARARPPTASTTPWPSPNSWWALTSPTIPARSTCSEANLDKSKKDAVYRGVLFSEADMTKDFAKWKQVGTLFFLLCMGLSLTACSTREMRAYYAQKDQIISHAFRRRQPYCLQRARRRYLLWV